MLVEKHRPLKDGVLESIQRGERTPQLSFGDLKGIDDFPPTPTLSSISKKHAPVPAEIAPELHDVMAFVLKSISRDIGIKRSGVYLYDSDKQQMTSYVELKDGIIQSPQGAVIKLSEEGVGTALVARLALGVSNIPPEAGSNIRLQQSGEPAVKSNVGGLNFVLNVNNARTNPLTQRGYVEAENCVWIPLYDERRNLVGVVWADNYSRGSVERPIDEQQQTSLMLVGQYAGALIQNTQLKVRENALLLASAVHSHGLDRKATLDAICDTVLEYTGADKVDIRTRPKCSLGC